MLENLPISEPALRFGSFILIFILMAALEIMAPRRPLTGAKAHRWGTNLGILVTATLTARLVGQISGTLVAVGAAAYAERSGWGLLNLIHFPALAEITLAVAALDLAIWFQHVISHKIPLFWRIHRVHHADRDIDLTTALRFHPGEIVLSMLYKTLIVLVLGPSAWAVILFEIILNGSAMFNHANARLPLRLDRFLRMAIVTPDFHRVHHSIHRDEHDANYGFFLSVWDRLFGTFIDQPRGGHEGMQIGLAPYQNEKPDQIVWSLKLPGQRL